MDPGNKSGDDTLCLPHGLILRPFQRAPDG